jgi:hypothetical protein
MKSYLQSTTNPNFGQFKHHRGIPASPKDNLLRHIKIPPGQLRIQNFPIPLPQFFTVIERLYLMAALIFLDQIGHCKFYGIAFFFLGILQVVL